jgi:hypothetical protein
VPHGGRHEHTTVGRCQRKSAWAAEPVGDGEIRVAVSGIQSGTGRSGRQSAGSGRRAARSSRTSPIPTRQGWAGPVATSDGARRRWPGGTKEYAGSETYVGRGLASDACRSRQGNARAAISPERKRTAGVILGEHGVAACGDRLT